MPKRAAQGRIVSLTLDLAGLGEFPTCLWENAENTMVETVCGLG